MSATEKLSWVGTKYETYQEVKHRREKGTPFSFSSTFSLFWLFFFPSFFYHASHQMLNLKRNFKTFILVDCLFLSCLCTVETTMPHPIADRHGDCATHQSWFFVHVSANKSDILPDVVVLAQYGIDFTELYPEAADLDLSSSSIHHDKAREGEGQKKALYLEVNATDALYRSVRKVPSKIARSVQSIAQLQDSQVGLTVVAFFDGFGQLLVPVDERIRQELLGGGFRKLLIAPS